MFYVFGINGPMYQGGPERLSHITPVRGVQRPGGLQANAAGVEGQASQARWAAADAPQPRPRDAVSAYASTEQSLQAPRRQLYVVADVMTRGAVTLPIGMRVREAWHLLASHKIAQAPVLDGQQRVVGLLLRADMAPLELLPVPGATPHTVQLAERWIEDVMLSPVPAVDESTDVRRVAQVLLDTGLPGLPVTDEQGRLSGFISRTDILRAVASHPPLDLWS